MNAQTPAAEQHDRPIISIYQNSEHVAGLVQQLFNMPLVTERRDESSSDNTETGAKEKGLSGGLDVGAALPGIGKAAIKVDAKGGKTTSEVVATGSKTTQSFVYSQAYYLNVVRRALREREQLTTLTRRSDVADLPVGSFVEYHASFESSAITTFMDVLTPDVVAQITRWLTQRSQIAQFESFGTTYDAIQAGAHKIKEISESNASLAREVASAIKSDFRQDKTREYYGHLGPSDDRLTLVTICDNNHFVVDDEDRILDGSFTVLGKLTSAVEVDVPVLERNKLLRNISAGGLDSVIEHFRTLLGGQEPVDLGGSTVDDLLDVKMTSRITGSSVRVIPIAIYV